MKRAQIKMMETIGILFIFFILIALAAAFFVRIQGVSVSRQVGESRDLRAIEVAQTVEFLPEIVCSENNVVEQDCFDLFKLRSLNATINDPQSPRNFDFYASILGFVRIKIDVIYPVTETLLVYDNSLPGFTQGSASNFPIAIYNPIEDSYSFGVMQVIVYNE